MAYGDPSKIRKHRVTLYMNDAEGKLLEATHEYIGGEYAPLLRDLLLKSAHRVLFGEADIRTSANQNEALQTASFKSQ